MQNTPGDLCMLYITINIIYISMLDLSRKLFKLYN